MMEVKFRAATPYTIDAPPLVGRVLLSLQRTERGALEDARRGLKFDTITSSDNVQSS